ncbi:MAG: translocation/assembly module TamB domain-containing protein, partial [candidate division WOR-3 bacterium]
MRRYLTVIILFIILATVYLYFAFNAGRLFIAFIEGRTKLKIEYDNLQGNILTGYRANHLKIKISPGDSLWADNFEIRYRLIPLVLHHPSAIEVNLNQPRLVLTQKESIRGRKPPVMALALNLILNIKNGQIAYVSKDTIFFDSIFGSFRVSTRTNRVNIFISDLSFGIPRKGIRVNSLSTALIISEQRLNFNYLTLKSEWLEFEGSGLYDLGEKLLSLSINNAHLDLKPLIKGLEGKGEVRGNITYQNNKVWGNGEIRVFNLKLFKQPSLLLDYGSGSFSAADDSIKLIIREGRMGSSQFKGEFKFVIPRTYFFDLTFDSLNLRQLEPRLPQLFIKGNLTYQTGKLKGKIFSDNPGLDSAHFSLTLIEKRFEIESLRAYGQNGRLLVRGDILPKLNLFIHTERYPLMVINEFFDLGLKGWASGSWAVFGDLKGPTITGRFRLTDIDWRDRCHCGEVNGVVNATLTQPEIERLEVEVSALQFEKQLIDHFEIKLAHRVFAVNIRADTSRFLSIEGKIDGLFAGQIDRVAGSVDGFEFKNLKPFPYDIKNKTIGEMEFSIGPGHLYARLSAGRPYVRITKLQIADLNKIFPRPRLYGIAEITLDGEKFNVECDSFKLLDIINYGELEIQGRAVGKDLLIDSLWVIDLNGGQAWARGRLGLEGLDVQARGSNLSLGVFAMLDKILERGQGRVNGEIRATGSYGDMNIDGQAQFIDSDCRLILTESPIRNASGNIRFEGKRIVFEKIDGFCGDGRASVQGYVQLGPKFKMTDLELRLVFEDCLGSFRPIVYGRGSGKIKVFYHKNRASYEGDVYVHEAILPLGFGTTIIRKKPTGKEGPWSMKIRFAGDRNIWLKNDMADVEMGGEIFLMKTDSDIYLSGELNSRRGRIYYLDHTLTVTEGKVVFTSDPEFNPMLDIRSEMVARGNITIIFRIT